MTHDPANERGLIRAALGRLQIDRLMLTVHDASFPAGVDEDVGHGSPYARSAAAFYGFAAARGFDGIQLGPQGKTSLANPSPYDGALMARSHLSVALGPLVDQPGLAGLLPAEMLARAVAHTPAGAAGRAHHRHAWSTLLGALRVAHIKFAATPGRFPALAQAQPGFLAANRDWLEADSLFEVLSTLHGTDDPARWLGPTTATLDQRLYAPAPSQQQQAPVRRHELLRAHPDLVAFNEFCQLLLHVQHQQLRQRLRSLGLRLSADLQVGLAPRDRWRHQALFLPGYAMGAPASRTNPDGQAWGYPVLEPGGLGGDQGIEADAPGLRFFERRLERLLADFDALRIDHPHGLICPWVYQSTSEPWEGSAPLAQVQAGARLYASPDLDDHPALARYAIAQRADLAPADAQRPRYAEDWVRRLSPAQIERYARLFDRVMALAAQHGLAHADVCAEVLSTCPFPVARVLDRHGLGRLRVVQKADPDNLEDPYRSAAAAPADWITLGTHDTRSIWPVVEHWQQSGRDRPWASYLAQRLAPQESARAALAQALASDRRRLMGALAADLFLGPARHVSMFFPDLFGLHDRYNVPGTIDQQNWTLRVPADFEARYLRQRESGDALDLRAALALALRAKARGAGGDDAELAAALERA